MGDETLLRMRILLMIHRPKRELRPAEGGAVDCAAVEARPKPDGVLAEVGVSLSRVRRRKVSHNIIIGLELSSNLLFERAPRRGGGR